MPESSSKSPGKPTRRDIVGHLRVPTLLVLAYVIPISLFGPRGDEPVRETIWTRRYAQQQVPPAQASPASTVRPEYRNPPPELEALWDFAPAPEKRSYFSWLLPKKTTASAQAQVKQHATKAKASAHQTWESAKNKTEKQVSSVVNDGKELVETTSTKVDQQMEAHNITRDDLIRYGWFGLRLFF